MRDQPFASYLLLNVHKFCERAGKLRGKGPEPDLFGERFKAKRYLLALTVSLWCWR